jgi:hypothetical protein
MEARRAVTMESRRAVTMESRRAVTMQQPRRAVTMQAMVMALRSMTVVLHAAMARRVGMTMGTTIQQSRRLCWRFWNI